MSSALQNLQDLLNVEAMVSVVFHFDNTTSSSLTPNALTLQPNLLCRLNDYLSNLSPFSDKYRRSADTPPRPLRLFSQILIIKTFDPRTNQFY